MGQHSYAPEVPGFITNSQLPLAQAGDAVQYRLPFSTHLASEAMTDSGTPALAPTVSAPSVYLFLIYVCLGLTLF
jgi:hypothetical protein